MPCHREQRHLLFPAILLFEIVADVERYPEFLPWCLEVHIREKIENRLVADMEIGFSGLRERFSSYVTLDPASLVINVIYKEGPFKSLINNWKFVSLGENQCMVNFFLEFELKSKPLSKLIDIVFHKAVQQMVAAFVTRADELYVLQK